MVEFVTVYDCDLKGLILWSILGNFENLEQARPVFEQHLTNIRRDNAETIARWKTVHGEDWEKAWADHGLAPMQNKVDTLRIMTWQEYQDLEYKSLTAQPIKEITSERFTDLLECLPPLRWTGNYLFESFFMSEFYTGSFTNQVIRIKINGVDRYFKKLVDINNPLNYDQTIELIKQG